ncbi:MAG: YkgJ family cysteine cluster protein [Desulfofustis sp. PB-SRB1]|jgi:Fe-S-cluster containining protein|nr:YkgJ family cysteine cluster protein [Desulfofustis sp. PB-SRB1]MBM1001524.1 YkgJ family cysteine cluster protein [Desulfofustis sp. PB-SRB1]HBH29074.1 hypothetical protein [Desulfofustis sp.]
MEPAKRAISAIYDIFDTWASRFTPVCGPGCAHCCTSDVYLTEVEARIIIDYIEKQDRRQWLVELLSHPLPPVSLHLTTNEFAAACLAGRDIDPGGGRFDSPCRLLDNDLCPLYEVRPFGCRCLMSTIVHDATQPAAAPSGYYAAATATQQIIEHLSRPGRWGELSRMLLAEAGRRSDPLFAALGSHQSYEAARTHGRKCRPVPGFLLDEQEYAVVQPLLTTIMAATVEGRTIENMISRDPGD